MDHKELGEFLGALYDAYVARIEVADDAEALKIFERTNARGLDLDISELLKNFLFSQKVNDIEVLWDKIVKNSGGTILRMLKYFYVSKRGYISKPKLYQNLKSYEREVTAAVLTQKLANFSDFYRVVKLPGDGPVEEYFADLGFTALTDSKDRYQKINRSLTALREFGVIQFCPVAYAAIECIERTESLSDVGCAKAFIRLMDNFERYHFINTAICSRLGNEVEQKYAEACVTYSKATNFIQTTDKFLRDLRLSLAPKEEFIANFSRLDYDQDPLSLLMYIFDRFNNQGLDPGQGPKIFDPDTRARRREFNVEHILPKTPDAPYKHSKADLAKLNNIGNLLALYFRDNSGLGNDLPAQKIERLKSDLAHNTQNLTIVKKFLNNYGDVGANWNADTITQRATDMASEAYKLWSF
jgi:hypothetical protein